MKILVVLVLIALVYSFWQDTYTYSESDSNTEGFCGGWGGWGGAWGGWGGWSGWGFGYPYYPHYPYPAYHPYSWWGPRLWY